MRYDYEISINNLLKLLNSQPFIFFADTKGSRKSLHFFSNSAPAPVLLVALTSTVIAEQVFGEE